MILTVQPGTSSSDARLQVGANLYRCAIGIGGAHRVKQEGDGRTPVGNFGLRRLYFRPDRLMAPESGLQASPLTPNLGWSDDPIDPSHYNQLVTLPHQYSHERLWRSDRVYDVIVEIGYNDDPARAGRGSAIFIHVARDDYAPTEGCVALSLPDLLHVLRGCDDDTRIEVLESAEI